MKLLTFALAILVVALTAGLLYELRTSSATARPPAAPPPPHEATPPSPHAATPIPPPPDVRVQIHAAYEKIASGLKTERDVDRYLDDLEAQARRNRQVTALEVEPGLIAIRHLGAELGPEHVLDKVSEFSQKMAKLSAEFEGRAQP